MRRVVAVPVDPSCLSQTSNFLWGTPPKPTKIAASFIKLDETQLQNLAFVSLDWFKGKFIGTPYISR